MMNNRLQQRTAAFSRFPPRHPHFFAVYCPKFLRRSTVVFSNVYNVVLDDLFLRKRVPDNSADDLLDINLTRYGKRKSTLITSNRPVEDWGKLLGDNAAASAIAGLSAAPGAPSEI